MVENYEKISKGLEVVLAIVLGTGAFGSVLGLEANIQPLNNVRIEDASFRAYLEQGRKQYGDGIGVYVGALWTYPGARLGVAIHNYGLPKNSQIKK